MALIYQIFITVWAYAIRGRFSAFKAIYYYTVHIRFFASFKVCVASLEDCKTIKSFSQFSHLGFISLPPSYTHAPVAIDGKFWEYFVYELIMKLHVNTLQIEPYNNFLSLEQPSKLYSHFMNCQLRAIHSLYIYIYIETHGVNNTNLQGKTTLRRLLSAALEYRIKHFEPPSITISGMPW